MEGMRWLGMGAIGAVMIPIMMVTTLVPVILYVIARWRVYRDPQPPDPQLGFKTALLYFDALGFQLLLLGVFILLWALISSEEDSGEQLRAGLGLGISGALITVAHFFALRQTNNTQMPIVARLFAGLKLMQTGIVGAIGLVLAVVSIFDRRPSGDFGRMAWSMAAVYCVAWFVLTWRFSQRFLKARAPGVSA